MQVEDLTDKAKEAERQRRIAQDKVVELEAKIKFLEGKGPDPSKGGDKSGTDGGAGSDKSGATKPDTSSGVRKPFRPRKSIPEAQVKVWFYDLNTNQLFASTKNMIAPIKAPSDKDGELSGVKAYVYSCEACDDPEKRTIIFLEKYTPEVKAKIEAHREEANNDNWVVHYAYADDSSLEEGILLRKPDDEEWISGAGSKGRSLKAIGENDIRIKCQAAKKRMIGCAPK
jgi:hypothetical protein